MHYILKFIVLLNLLFIINPTFAEKIGDPLENGISHSDSNLNNHSPACYKSTHHFNDRGEEEFIPSTRCQDIHPSFDCKKAKTTAEKAICSDKILATLDKNLAIAYTSLKEHPQGKIKLTTAELIKNQKTWLKELTNDNCLNVQCITTKYSKRLLEFTFPGAPLSLTTDKMKQLQKFFADKDSSEIEDLRNSSIVVNEGLESFVCKLYEWNPHLAFKLTQGEKSSIFCDPAPETKKVIGLSLYIDHLRQLYGPDRKNFTGLGSRAQTDAILLALNDTDISLDAQQVQKTTPTAAPYSFWHKQDLLPDLDRHLIKRATQDDYSQRMGVYAYPSLLHFSWQGLWQQQQYEKHLQLKENARKGLEKYYTEVKKILAAKAKQAAEFHVQNLANQYVAGHYSRYQSLGLNDVDDFLKTGTLPDYDDYRYTYDAIFDGTITEDEAKAEVLAYFLKLAVLNGYSKEAIEKILTAGANIKNSKLTDNALMNAVKRPDIMKLLIDKGMNVNAQNKFGKTALMYAIQYGDLAAIKLLIDHKADVNLSTFAKKEDYFLTAGNRTPLMYAAWHANNEVIQYLISTGANVNAKDSQGHDYKYYLTINDHKNLLLK